MYVIKARTSGCVRNDNETHETVLKQSPPHKWNILPQFHHFGCDQIITKIMILFPMEVMIFFTFNSSDF